MTMSAFLELITYACVTGFSPGPNNILMLAISSKSGFRRCLPTMAGIWTGSLSIMLLCGLFCNALMSWVPGIRPVMKYAGAVYILYLAWNTFRRKPAGEGADFQPGFFTALLLQYLNVKMIIYGITAYTGFILPYENRVPVLMSLAVVLMSAGAAGNVLWAAAGSVLRRFYNQHYRLINVVMGMLLLWCAVRITA